MNSEAMQKPVADQCADDVNRRVADETETIAPYDLARQVAADAASSSTSVMVVRLLKYGPAVGCNNITRGTFRSRIGVSDRDGSACCSKRECGRAAYPRRGTRD